MGTHHCWYVTGRILRLAVALCLFASLGNANPAFSAEDTGLAGNRSAIYSRITAISSGVAEWWNAGNDVVDDSTAIVLAQNDVTDPSAAALQFDQTVASPSAANVETQPNAANANAAINFYDPATKINVGGDFVYQNDNKKNLKSILDYARKVSGRLNTIPQPPEYKQQTAPAIRQDADVINQEQSSLPTTGEVFPAVLEVSRNGNTIVPSVVVWEQDLNYFIPVKQLADALKFPSIFDSASRKVQGQFIGPENTYTIDARAGTFTANGKTLPLPAGAILQTPNTTEEQISEKVPDDIYISVDLLNKIWPLDFAVNNNSQSLTINAPRKIPAELEAERKAQQEKLERAKMEAELEKNLEKKYIFTPNGYRLLGPQTFFISNSLQSNESSNDTSHSMLLSGQGDVLGTSASYSLSTINSREKPIDIQDFSVRLRREDYKSGKMLPFGLDLVDLGDISVRTPSLVSGSIQGTGVFISTSRDRKDIDFDEINVEGNGRPGWDVELYSRGVLVDFGKVDALGRYRFTNVPLTYGNNILKLVFYGPQGEVEERTETHNIARSLLKPGEMTYQGGIVKRGTRVIDVSDTSGDGPGIGSSFRINRGINQYLSGFATFSNLEVKGSEQKYATIGANFNALGGFGQVEAYKQFEKGIAGDIRFAFGYKGFDTSLRSSVFNDFESPRAGFGDSSKTTETSVSTSKGFVLPFGQANLGLGYTYTTYKDELAETNFDTSQSITSPLGNLSNRTNSQITGGEHKNTQGDISYNKKLADNWGINSRVNYTFHPKQQFESYDVDLNYTDNDRFTANVGYSQSLIDSSSHNISLGASYDFDALSADVNVGIDSNNGIDFTLGTNTTFGPEGVDGYYKFRRTLAGQNTQISVRLFEDLNNNGRYDADDVPIPGARVVLNGGKKTPPSNDEGYIEDPIAGQEGLTTITLDRKSLSFNPFLISAKKDGYLTVLRAGTKPHIDFPLVMSGTIDGTVRDQDGNGMTNISVQLIDAHGILVAESKTLIDGFYNFEFVRPGRYVVQIHPSHRVFVPPKTVVVAPDDLFVYAADLQVLSNQDLKQASAAAVAHDVEETGRVAHTYQPRAAVGTEKPVDAVPPGGGVQPVAGEVSDRGVQPAIRAVRIGEYSDKVRLVLDLSGPAVYKVNKEASGNVVTVDLPDTAWEAAYSFVPDKHNMFANIEAQQRPEGGTRITITGKAAINVSRDLFLPAEAGTNDRIFIDFMPAP